MSEKHSICLLNDSFPPVIDGVANAVYNYAKLIEEKHGHAIVATPQVPDVVDKDEGFTIVRYPSIDTRKMFGYVTGYPFSPETARTIEAEKAEVLHTHCPVTSCLLARQLAESQGLPLVLTYHTKFDIDIANMVRSKTLQKGAIQALLRNINACDEIWTVSQGAGENLRSLGYEGDYIVMPNGVDLPREQATPELVQETTGSYDLPADVPCFLFIGRLMWYKGLRIILDALKQLDNDGADFRMIFVGGGGDEAEVKAYSTELGLNAKVFFTGAISDRSKLRAWYTRADLFLFPSTFDTNGLVVREAAASDTASVIIKDSCASEGVVDNRNGFLIEENADSLAAKLRELTANPEIMKTVGKCAGDEIYISWDDAVAHAYDRYEVVIDNYKSGKYGTRLPYDYTFMRSQGELMQTLGNIDAAGKEMRAFASALREDTVASIESLRDDVIAEYEAKKSEAIAEYEDAVASYEAKRDEVIASYEAKLDETIAAYEARRDEAIAAYEAKRLERINKLRETREEFWEKLERYL